VNNNQRLAHEAEKRRFDAGMMPAPKTRSERRALARQIVAHSPGLIEKIAEEEGVSRVRAKALAVRYIAGIRPDGPEEAA
jgi:hypothetical protein